MCYTRVGIGEFDMKKYILCLFLSLWSVNAMAQAGNLPNNPWGASEQTSGDTQNTAQNPKETSIEKNALPQNPWNTTGNKQPMGQKITYKPRYRQTATVNSSINTPIQPHRTRQVGGVGRIGYTYTSRAESTQNNDNHSLFEGIFDDSPATQTMPEAPTSGAIIPESDFDLSYEKLKQKGLQKWHNLTSPITNTAKKWFNSVKQTGEDLLK